MQPQSLRRVSRRLGTGILGLALAIFAGSHVQAQSPSDAQLAELLKRIEKLEQEKQGLSQRLEAVERSEAQPQAPQPAPDQPAVARVAAFDEPIRPGAATPNLSTNDAGDSAATAAKLDAQGQQLSALQKAFKSFQDKAGEKKYPNISMNGVFQADSVWVHQDEDSLNEFGRIEDGAGFRRARLSAKGNITEHTNYMFQFDLGTGGIGRPTITDIWVEETGVPVLGNVRVGQWKQPFSLEVVSSFRYTTFMERSVLFQAFTPFRRLGAGFYDHNDDLTMTWAASGFHSGQDQFGDTYTNDQGYGTSERVTFLPWWECEGTEYLHLGLGHFFNAPVNQTVNFRTIPEIFVGAQANGPVGSSGQAIPGALNGVPFFIATGNLSVNAYNVLGTELLWVEGPLSVQSEAMVNFVDQTGDEPTGVLAGVYAQVGYFLTGEHRPYDRKAGAIDRVIPNRNMKFCGDNGNGCGYGAWEVAARFSYLDLSDENIQGGTLTDYTVGVNWFLNPYLKCVFNWIHAMPDSPAFPKSQTDFFGIRTQADF
jgi:phosphate-selective porin OprO/OprP